MGDVDHVIPTKNRKEFVVNIRDVNVCMPVKPYPGQKQYMEKVIEALDNKSNALLESPTGTGKTLALLCSVLAWRENRMNMLKGQLRRVQDTVRSSESSLMKKMPKILYASRTHSQLNQVVNELKRTPYRPYVSILSSRDNTCVKREFAQMSGSQLRSSCLQAVKDDRCAQYQNLEGYLSSLDGNGGDLKENLSRIELRLKDQSIRDERLIMDIEDLAKLGSQKNICPYHLSRHTRVQQKAEIIFMPYTYLVDESTRRGLKCEEYWKNSILIVDEAHNFEKQCEEGVSFKLTTEDLDKVLSELGKFELACQQFPQELSERAKLANTPLLCQFVKSLCKVIMEANLVKSNGVIGRLFEGKHMVKLLSAAGVRESDAVALDNHLSQVVEYDAAYTYIAKLKDCIQTVFHKYRGQDSDLAHNKFGVYIEQDKQTGSRVLNYWCFSSSVKMAELKAMGVQSIILTSGTLSPLDTFDSEMGLSFPIKFENAHVIHQSQVFVGVVVNGVNKVKLNSTYKNRSNPKYLEELGTTIDQIFSLVPDGALVFFPSYSVMDLTIQYWQNCGIFSRLQQAKKIFVEPKRSGDMSSVIENYERTISRGNGAALFAVCRGKASEGIDFADQRARCVIITGIPFPPAFDARVRSKKQYLDKPRPWLTHSVSSVSSGRRLRLTGEMWYRQQAYRAVNQAIGRVIRHRNDYGAVLLLDERFAGQEPSKSMSRWLRSSITAYKHFPKLSESIVSFFNQNRSIPELNRGKINLKPLACSRGSGSSRSSSSSTYLSMKRRQRDTIVSGRDKTSKQPRAGGTIGSLFKKPIEKGDAADQSQQRRIKIQQATKSFKHQFVLKPNTSSPTPEMQAFIEMMKTQVLSKKDKKSAASDYMKSCKQQLPSHSFASFKRTLGTIRSEQENAPHGRRVELAQDLCRCFNYARDETKAETLRVQLQSFLPAAFREQYRLQVAKVKFAAQH